MGSPESDRDDKVTGLCHAIYLIPDDIRARVEEELNMYEEKVQVPSARTGCKRVAAGRRSTLVDRGKQASTWDCGLVWTAVSALARIGQGGRSHGRRALAPLRQRIRLMVKRHKRMP